ncbi:protein fam83b [Limosa lapponica baueri]|uniref:Protein fam83b n=1 Tax=Limosa lapponica baueri TaxID=1758121 RepID=A0A2I0TNE7_LIMLA|nr:protein fam83b [Limosa lapponica baueri]
METSSLLSSLHDECRSDNYIEPHYKEWYRVAIDALIEGGLEAYKEFLSKERCSEFLADEEIDYILNNVHKLPQNTIYSSNHAIDDTSSSGTYWPIESDVEAPNLDLGWPYLMPGISGGTNIDLLFHPPRAQPYTIKETIRKMIRDARKNEIWCFLLLFVVELDCDLPKILHGLSQLQLLSYQCKSEKFGIVEKNDYSLRISFDCVYNTLIMI